MSGETARVFARSHARDRLAQAADLVHQAQALLVEASRVARAPDLGDGVKHRPRLPGTVQRRIDRLGDQLRDLEPALRAIEDPQAARKARAALRSLERRLRKLADQVGKTPVTKTERATAKRPVGRKTR